MAIRTFKAQGIRHKPYGKSEIQLKLSCALRPAPYAVSRYRLSGNSHPGSPKNVTLTRLRRVNPPQVDGCARGA